MSHVEKNKNKEIFIKNIHEFVLNSNGYLNFATIIPKTEGNIEDLENLNIFYTDNFGVVKKLKKNNLTINFEIDESLWENRKKMVKNLEESNLAKIITYNRLDAIKIGSVDNFCGVKKNEIFESSLKKIETTPAFLMPKVGDFCFNILKSMLIKNNEN